MGDGCCRTLATDQGSREKCPRQATGSKATAETSGRYETVWPLAFPIFLSDSRTGRTPLAILPDNAFLPSSLESGLRRRSIRCALRISVEICCESVNQEVIVEAQGVHIASFNPPYCVLE